LNGAAEVGPGLISGQVSACLTTSYTWFEKSIVINLAAEGFAVRHKYPTLQQQQNNNFLE